MDDAALKSMPASPLRSERSLAQTNGFGRAGAALPATALPC